MNREQRRHPERFGIGRAPATTTLTVRYGTDGQRVVVVFPRPVSDLRMTPAEVDAMIEQLQMGKRLLAEQQQANAAQDPPVGRIPA